MIHLHVFISYRRDDGSEIARSLYNSIQGTSIVVRRGVIDTFETISVYLDQKTLAVPDWTAQCQQYLEQASAFIIICSPGARSRLSNDDELHREIDWWLTHRSNECPILVATFGEKYIPDSVSRRWPQTQFFEVDPNVGKFGISLSDDLVRKILSSLAERSANRDDHTKNRMANSEVGIISPTGLFVWEKDKHFRYTNCNEEYARAAGVDSPHAMIGKTDDEMPWRHLADEFRAGDQGVISGRGPRIHVQEKEITVDGEIPILVWERASLDQRGECIGLHGYFVDLTGVHLEFPSAVAPTDNQSYCLGPQFNNEYFSSIEARVFEAFLKTNERNTIAAALSISRPEVESHLRSIKQKLQCVTDGDVTAAAMRSGLPLLLSGLRATKRA